MSDVDKIKDAVSVVDVVSRYVELKKAGINYAGRCPFHNEKTPSFYVSPDRGSFKCFGCGEGGDVITFLEKIEGLDFREVLTKLSEETGIPLTAGTSTGGQNSVNKDTLYDVLKKATVFWQKTLVKNPQALEYLKKRNFTKQQLLDYQIGYAPNAWEDLKNYLDTQGVPLAIQEEAGLIKKGDTGKHYDRFRDRIIFPLRDSGGRVVAFSGRYIGSDDVSAKYLNSPETPVFNKSKELYGLDMAKNAMRKNNFAVIVEGQVDLVMSQSVFPNSVATSGTSLTRQHLEQIKRFCDRLVFVFDSDNAGIEAAHKASLLALQQDFQVKIVTLPQGSDPADIVVVDENQYRTYIKDAYDVFDFWIHHILHDGFSPREKNKKIEEKIIPLLAIHGNALEQDRYIKHCAFKLDVSQDALLNLLHAQSSKQHTAVQSPQINDGGGHTDQTGVPGRGAAYLALLHVLGTLELWNKSLSDGERWATDADFTKLLSDDVRADYERAMLGLDPEVLSDQFFEIEKKYKTRIILENEILELQQNLLTRKKQITQHQLLKKQKKLIQEGKDEEAKEVLQALTKLHTQNG